MKKFDIYMPLPSKKGESERLLIPVLLPKDKPPNADEEWPEYPPSFKHLQYARVYKLEYLPNSLPSKLLLRLLHYSYARAYWHNGVIISTEKIAKVGKFSINTEKEVKALIEIKGNEIHILVRGVNVVVTASFLRLIIEMVDLLLVCWYDIKHEVLIPCPHCAVASGMSSKDGTVFTLEQCDAQASTGNTLFFCKDSKIPLDLIAPDVAMEDFSGVKLDFKKLEVGAELAANKYRKVNKGVLNNEVVAVKEFLLASDRTPVEVFKEFRREVWTMSSLQHPNIVRLLGYCPHPMVVVMEFIKHGDLYEFLEKPVDWPMRFKIALDIAQGMTFLHSSTPPLIHRDLKTPNIFMVATTVDAPVVCKVGDFGTSSRLYIDELQESSQRAVDNPTWLAPEVLRGNPYTEKSDVYAFGVMLWELVSGQRPFSDRRWFYEIEDFVNNGGRPAIPEDLHFEFAELIRKCWDSDIRVRPTFEDCLISLIRLKDELVPSLCTPIYSKYKPEDKIISQYLAGKPTHTLLEGVMYKQLAVPVTTVINCIAWVGATVWAGTQDGTLIIWSAEEGEFIARYQAHWEAIYNLVVLDKTVWTMSSYQLCVWQGDLVKEAKKDTRRSMTNDGAAYFDVLTRISSKDKTKTKVRYLNLSNGTLYSYVQKTDPLPEKGYPIEPGMTVEKDKKTELAFIIRRPDGKRRTFVAENAEKLDTWVACLAETISQVAEGYSELRLKLLMQHDFTTALTSIKKLGVSVCVGIFGRKMRMYKRNGEFEDAVVDVSQHVDTTDTQGDAIWNSIISSMVSHENDLWVALGKNIYKLNAQTFEEAAVLKGHGAAVLHLTLIEKALWSYALDNSIRLWDITSSKSLKIIPCSMITAMIQVGGDVWIARQDQTISVWNLKTFKEKTLKVPETISSLALVWDKEMWISSQTSITVWM